MHMDTGFLLKRCGLTADQVRNSSLVSRIVSAPTNNDPVYLSKLTRNRDYKRQRRRELKAGRRAEWHRRYAKQVRQANLARGLTTHGKVRQLRARVTELERLEMKTTLDRIRMDNYLAQGLTTNGTPRKYKSKHCPNFKAK